ncbi:MAG: 16S rRNA (uracil(1498)-N(3))-methyltransferase [Clostridia bacterium]|nr:16S rRNA (uracil(1498)-N(3))-methyltransferase [Clostridia bacterium]
MPKFFITEHELEIGGKAYIRGEDANHLRKSLRIRNGEIINVCDGNGNDYNAMVESSEGDSVKAVVLESVDLGTEPGLWINLYAAVTKGEGFEYAIQKCVEAGVGCIIPVITERTIVAVSESKAGRKHERWNKIAAEAAKQSGRSRIPIVAEAMDFAAAINMASKEGFSIICNVEEDTISLKSILGMNKDIGMMNIFIGPEGGFTNTEIKAAAGRGIHSVTLGNRILKAETAGLFVMAAVMYEYGELDKKGSKSQ